MARYDGCTHVKCEYCDNYTKKGWTACDDCRRRKDTERFNAMPVVEWDRVTPICLFRGDKFFFSEDGLLDYCEEEDVKPEDLQLVLCTPNYLFEVSEDYWADIMPDDSDGDLPKPIREALATFNKVITDYGNPISWGEGKTRVIYTNPTHP